MLIGGMLLGGYTNGGYVVILLFGFFNVMYFSNILSDVFTNKTSSDYRGCGI